jgi:hypothetical protein
MAVNALLTDRELLALMASVIFSTIPDHFEPEHAASSAVESAHMILDEVDRRAGLRAQKGSLRLRGN